MTGKTGYTAPTNDSPFAPPADITAVYEHYDPLFWETVSTSTSLPAASGSQNRVIMAQDTLWVYRSNGTAWEVVSTPWTPYTPAWTATGTPPTLGNSTIAGSYQRIRNTVNFKVYFKFGSSAGWGGGSYRFSLPIACKTGATIRVPALAHIEVSGSGYFAAVGVIQGGSSLVELFSSTAGAGFLVSNSSPSWTVGSVISVSGSYEVA